MDFRTLMFCIQGHSLTFFQMLCKEYGLKKTLKMSYGLSKHLRLKPKVRIYDSIENSLKKRFSPRKKIFLKLL